MVHGSLRSFGRVVGGAPTVITALQEVVTAAGTLMMPSFNHGSIFDPGEPGVYDPLTSPTSNGVIPQCFWQSPNVYRSLNPTHPFACWGDKAQQYVQNHHRTLTLGPESPLGLLAQDDGYGLLLGVGYQVNTLHHVAEYQNNAPCLGRRTRTHLVRLSDGRLVEGRTWSFRGASCPITDEARYAHEMQARGLEHKITIGRSQITFFRLRDCLDVVVEMLQKGVDAYPPCHACPIRPDPNDLLVNSDWDHEHGRPFPSSACWDY